MYLLHSIHTVIRVVKVEKNISALKTGTQKMIQHFYSMLLLILLFCPFAFSNLCAEAITTLNPSILISSSDLQEYRGQNGYLKFVEKRYPYLKMDTVFLKISKSLSKQNFFKLGWKAYHGTTAEFRQERDRILDSEEDFTGMKGYAEYALEHLFGNMPKAFKNVSAVLSKEEFSKLGWKAFIGTSDQFYKLIEYFKTHKFEDYKGKKRQRKLANKIFGGQIVNTYRNVSVLSELLFGDRKEFKNLMKSGWTFKKD